MDNYGKKIKELREKAGLTQAKLAEIIGFKTPFYLSQLETGKRDAGLSVLNKICRAFGIELFEFFKEQPPKIISLRQTAISKLIEGIPREKQKLIKTYIETVKDMDAETIKRTILYAKKEGLWMKHSMRRERWGFKG